MAMALTGALAVTACGPVDDSDKKPAGEENLTVLGPGEKADNFRSESAQEYFVEGVTDVTLADEYADKTEEERLQRVEDLIPYKQVAIGYFLNTYLIDKSNDGENADYGGFKALTKNGSYEDMVIKKVGDLRYEFMFVQEVGGQLDLLEELARRADAERNPDGSYSFELAVGELSNEEMTQLDHGREWYRRSPWSTFSTSSVDSSKYYMQEVKVRPQERSDDAWLEYDRLFEDGTVNIEIFFGWDYHSEYHRKHSKTIYNWLVDNGYDSPASSWEDYAENRGPLTATIDANGEQVDVEVTLWWGEPGTATDPDTRSGGNKLEEEMRESFRNNEVTAFSGHSGPWYGFALANWKKTPAGDLDDSEIPGLEMPSDKYQIVLAEGCDTYALGEAFWKNPNKSDRENLDIITTTSFSNAGTHKAISDFLTSVIGADRTGDHEPMTYSKLLEDLDSNSYWFETMYGVHGIDDNPKAHPYAQTQNLCGECVTNSDCGGQGNKCVDLQGASVCTYECTADAGCPDGYSCQETRSGNYLSSSVCVPDNYTCEAPPEEEEATPVTFTEVLADPASGLSGDLNGDGTRDARGDEFVELVNNSDEAIDLAGWRLADSVTVRYSFPADTELAPGQKLVLFGGGDVDSFSGLPDEALVLSAGSSLYLNNSGDELALIDHQDKTVDEVRYGDEGGEDMSLVRTDDGTLTVSDTEPTPGK